MAEAEAEAEAADAALEHNPTPPSVTTTTADIIQVQQQQQHQDQQQQEAQGADNSPNNPDSQDTQTTPTKTVLPQQRHRQQQQHHHHHPRPLPHTSQYHQHHHHHQQQPQPHQRHHPQAHDPPHPHTHRQHTPHTHKRPSVADLAPAPAASVHPPATTVTSTTSTGTAIAAGSPASPTTPAAAAAAASSRNNSSASSSSDSGAPQRPLPFVAPSSYLRPRSTDHTAHVASGDPKQSHDQPAQSNLSFRVRPMSPLDQEELEGLRTIRAFLKVRTSYDVLPLSFRLIVFDTALLVKKSLNILIQNGIVSAPLWDSKTSTFAGLLTVSDYINVIQYYVQNPDSLGTIDQFRLNSLRDIEKAIGVQPLETISAHPMQPLYTACRRMLESRARRIPLVDFDDETNRSMIVSVVTQYRILKFVAVNVKETQMLRKRLADVRCATTEGLQTAFMDTPVMDVITLFVKYSISSVPILDDEGTLVNVFEAVDVIALIKGGVYDDLSLTVGEALLKRSDDFPGIFTCTLNDRLDSIFDTIRKSRVHRFVVIDEDRKLRGLLTLSDILEYILLEGVEGDES
ncbi:hypothetical protein AAFC00_006267 [Neodothiora populina]